MLSPRSSENGIKPLSSELSQWCYTFQTLALISEIWGCSWSNEEFIRIQKHSVRTRAVLSKIRKLVTMPLSCMQDIVREMKYLIPIFKKYFLFVCSFVKVAVSLLPQTWWAFFFFFFKFTVRNFQIHQSVESYFFKVKRICWVLLNLKGCWMWMFF